MGTTLTGTTPQDTYDSLIKVTNNGPLSSTARYLSDGLGNDSVLALSTSAAGVGTTTMARKFNIDGGSITSDTPTLRISSTDGSGTRKFGIEFFSNNGADVRGKLLADNNGRVYLDDNGGGGVVLQANGGTGNVGIGTSSPSYKLDVSGISSSNTGFLISSGQYDNIGQTPYTGMFMTGSSSTDGFGALLLTSRTDLARPIIFGTSNGSISVERVRIDANGLKFNGDTAAANALDDYEEGTWTMGVSFGGASVGVTYAANTGTYTKIGRQVTVNGFLALTSKGSSSGNAFITGLPFTIPNNNANYSCAALRFNSVTFANQFQGFGEVNTSTIKLEEVTEAGVVTNLTNADFANTTDLILSLTYFV